MDAGLAGVGLDERGERAAETGVPGIGQRCGVRPLDAARQAGAAADRDGQAGRRR
jgi:hypothetical protein